MQEPIEKIVARPSIPGMLVICRLIEYSSKEGVLQTIDFFVYLSNLKKYQLMDYSKIETWVLLLFIFFFGVLLIRYILSVDKLLKNQERTHEMLKLIAEKIGIDKATIENIDKE